MGIIGGTDERRVIRPDELNFTRFPLPAVTAIDTHFNTLPDSYNSYGSGIVIAPNYVLTAAHVVYNYKSKQDATKVRVTTSENATPDNLISRVIGNPQDPSSNVNTNNGIYYPFPKFDNRKYDIALLQTNNILLPADEVVGLIAFVNPEDNEDAIKGKTPIHTAGYPADNIPGITTVNGITNNTGLQLRDLTLAPGSFSSFGNITIVYHDRRINYTSNVDTYQGQSGSGIWHTLEGDSVPRVLGIHNSDVGVGGFTSFNSGILFDTDLYYDIIKQIENAVGVTDGNNLPENAIIGSDPGFFSSITGGGNDEIFGTYRRERIIGNGGEDRLFGGGADDRLEGGDGVDQALFSDVFTNYDFTINDPTKFKFVHSKGSQIDGTDTTQDIEFGVFEFTDTDGDNQDDDDSLFFVPLQVDPNDNSR